MELLQIPFRGGGFGYQELILIVILVIVLFGVGKLASGLPQLGKGMGQAVGEFRQSIRKKNRNDSDDNTSKAVTDASAEEKPKKS